MALMPPLSRAAPEDVAAGDVWVATGADGQIASVVALAPGDTPGTLESRTRLHTARIGRELLEPEPMGRSVLWTSTV